MPKSKSRCCRSCEKRILFHDLYQVLFKMDFFSSFHLFQKKYLFIFQWRNNYFLHWNFDLKSCFVMFFLEWNEWKNPQFNFSRQNLSIERNFFKWDGKETKISHLLFHRIWKKLLLISRNWWYEFTFFRKDTIALGIIFYLIDV